VLLGLKSSGPHSNGYSLIRKIIARSGVDLAAAFDGATYLDRLIAPTRIYVKTVLALLKAGLPVHGMAHITGGGITDNLPRMFPAGLVAEVKLQSWMRPAIFDWLADEGQVPAPEMLRTFNCGIGFVLVVPASAASDVTEALQNSGEEVVALGQVVAGEAGVEAFVRYV
jgi:phosphoribosylformylglycinamidine cyclo-ligase